jgi:hypothetical protein
MSDVRREDGLGLTAGDRVMYGHEENVFMNWLITHVSGTGCARFRVRLFALAAGLVLALSAAALAAGVAQAAGQLQFNDATTAPPGIAPGENGTMTLSLTNVGDEGIPLPSITISATLPESMVATTAAGPFVGLPGFQAWSCAIAPSGHTVTCTGNSNLTLPAGATQCNLFGFFVGGCNVAIGVRADANAALGPVSTQVEACATGLSPCATKNLQTRIKHYGEDFGLAKINDGVGPLQDSPAFPGSDVFWAGACDRLSAPAPGSGIDMSADGGVGSIAAQMLIPNGANSPRVLRDAPAKPRHCIDWGAQAWLGTNVWAQTPAWRLPAETRAGAHPDGTTTMAVNRPVDGAVDNILVDLPAGFVGNPEAVPQCPSERFQRRPPTCPPETQVGVINLHLVASPFGGNSPELNDDTLAPVWNIEPREGRVAELGFAWASGDKATTVLLTAKPRSGSDNGVSGFVGQVPAPLPFLSQSITLWGVPWAAHNDRWRAAEDLLPNIPGTCSQVPGQLAEYIPHTGFTPECGVAYDRSWGPIKPFLSNETDCNPAPTTGLQMDSYQAPGKKTSWGEPDRLDSNWKRSTSPSPAVEKCESLGFAPNFEAVPTTRKADGSSGLDVDLSVPQNDDARTGTGSPLAVPGPGATEGQVDAYVQSATDYWRSDQGRATAHLKDTVLRLPEGLSLNPAGATGLEACSDAVVGVREQGNPPLFFTNDPSDGLDGDDCPDGSRIGTVSVETPLLADDLTGDVILGEPKSTNPQSGEMFRMFLIVRDKQHGLLVKIYGSAVADPNTGQLTATFLNNPELPFSDLHVDIKSGSRGLLAAPRSCGAPAWSVALRPWSSVGAATPVADSTDGGAITVDSGCDNAFAPSLEAGVDNSRARAQGAKYSFRLTRPEGQQTLRGLTARLPKGLLASVRGVPLCKDAQAAAGACPAGSQIGIADAAAGSGDPFVLEEKGQVFLTEGYRGGEYGLMVKIRVIAGPFRGAHELSPIIVRQALHVNRTTAEVTAISDPLPTIHHGVPLRTRQITVVVDRGGFMVNPSDCSRTATEATLGSLEGASATASAPFRASDCRALPFKPRLGLTLTGRKQVTTGKHPGVKALVRQAGTSEAGIKRAEVRLPKSLALDPDNAQALCDYEQGIKDEPNCPKGSIVGRARAVSPLLNRPLTGNVYFVKNVRRDAKTGNAIRTLPMLIVALRGEISINLRGESDVKGAKLVNTFASVPDAPISQFNLNIAGGKNGILAVTRTRRAKINLCKGKHIAETDMDGQNGKQHDFDVRMKTPCPKPKKGKKKATRSPKR